MIFAIENQSAFERDALAHFKGKGSQRLVDALSAGVALFHNVLSELQRAGVCLRIVAADTKFSDTPGLEKLRRREEVDGTGDAHANAVGIYSPEQKIVAVREGSLLDGGENPYYVLVHEFAHAIWFELLSSYERGEVAEIYAKELYRQHPEKTYRTENVFEFFAEGFTYFVTPKLPELVTDDTPLHLRDAPVVMMTEEKNRVGLEWANVHLYHWLERKFKNIIDPALIQCAGIEGGFWEKDEEGGLCIPTYRGFIDSFSEGLKVIEREIT